MKQTNEAALSPVDFDTVFEDDEAMDRLLQNAVAAALRDHKAAGNSIAVWRDGKVVLIPSNEIPDLPEEPAVPAAALSI